MHETRRQGLYGWPVTGCTPTMNHSGYWARRSSAHGGFDKSMSSTAGDFRNLTPLVLTDALRRAGTRAYGPMHRFRLEIPADTFGATVPVGARLRAVPGTQQTRGASCVLEGEMPAVRVREMQHRLPAPTRGEGVLDCAFDRYRCQPAGGGIPTHPRTATTTPSISARNICCASRGALGAKEIL